MAEQIKIIVIMAVNGCQICCQQKRNVVVFVHRFRKLEVLVRPRHFILSIFRVFHNSIKIV